MVDPVRYVLRRLALWRAETLERAEDSKLRTRLILALHLILMRSQ
jgi:hypothetical protein